MPQKQSQPESKTTSPATTSILGRSEYCRSHRVATHGTATSISHFSKEHIMLSLDNIHDLHVAHLMRTNNETVIFDVDYGDQCES